MKKNLSREFNNSINSIDYLCGKILGREKKFTLEDLCELEQRLINLSLNIDTMLSQIMDLSKTIKNENRIYAD
tara:strand:- start:2419 stop:2637 length:219 start_codon:yes stop_codon:yes gene_type:complete